jgi:rhodanese-related sulfurtransferase
MQKKMKLKKVFQAFMAGVLSLVFVGALSACAPVQKIDPASVAALVDVRTPEEFAEGHLDGAINIDFQSASFSSQISQLDESADYIIYCRSGNRAGKAIELMQQQGFTGKLHNAGGVDSASSTTGLPVVN